LNERSDLHAIKRAMFVKSAKEIGIELENTSGKLVPAKGSEIGLLERLDDRPYTTALKPGPRPAFVARQPEANLTNMSRTSSGPRLSVSPSARSKESW
jgi:hypothetical protein